MVLNREGHEGAIYFVGPEIEHTPAFGMKTLFVVGLRAVAQIVEYAEEQTCKHIYLAANCSFQKNKLWNTLIPELLNKGYKVTLDWPIEAHDYVMETLDPFIASHKDFTPIVSCKYKASKHSIKTSQLR